MKRLVALSALMALLSGGLSTAQASDPAGTWSTCVNQTGKKIIVEGPRCPRNWRKVYE